MSDGPTFLQLKLLKVLALTRDISDICTTRAERWEAVQRVVANGLTREGASVLIDVFRRCPTLPNWLEKTELFAKEHAEQVRQLEGVHSSQGVVL